LKRATLRFDSPINEGKIKFWKYLRPFGSEYFVFLFAVQNFKDKNNLWDCGYERGCQNWSPSPREKNRPRTLENKKLRRIFGS